MKDLLIVKVGGNIIDDENKLSAFLAQFATMPGKKILVHGGGKLATRLGEQLGIRQQLVEGRRVTDSETLKIVTMVYAGYINKNIVAGLQSFSCNAIGLSGADGNSIRAHKRTKGNVDYGFAGDIDNINAELLTALLEQELTLVFSAITHNGAGQLLNTNADTIAQEVATALSADYSVTLVYGFEKAGVLMNADDDSTVISTITSDSYAQLKDQQVIFAGMIPKLDNAFTALSRGVRRVIIGRAEQLPQLVNGSAGTTISA